MSWRVLLGMGTGRMTGMGTLRATDCPPSQCKGRTDSSESGWRGRHLQPELMGGPSRLLATLATVVTGGHGQCAP